MSYTRNRNSITGEHRLRCWDGQLAGARTASRRRRQRAGEEKVGLCPDHPSVHGWHTVAGVLPVALFFLLTVCGKADPSSMSQEQRLAYGKRLYWRHCAACHGAKGDGRGKQALRLSTPPTDFTAGRFKYKSTPYGQIPTDEDLFRAIQSGVPATEMRAHDDLSEPQIRALVDYLKTLAPVFTMQPPAKPIPMPPRPQPSKALVERGRRMYVRAGCVKCHGAEGRGDGPAVDVLHDDWGRPVKPADLGSLPRKVGSELRDLYRVIQTGMEGTPMPSYRGILSPEQTWAVVYYLDSLTRH